VTKSGTSASIAPLPLTAIGAEGLSAPTSTEAPRPTIRCARLCKRVIESMLYVVGRGGLSTKEPSPPTSALQFLPRGSNSYA